MDFFLIFPRTLLGRNGRRSNINVSISSMIGTAGPARKLSRSL